MTPIRNLAIAFILLLAHGAVADVSEEDLEFFEKKIRPILVNRCYECHGPEKQKGGLRLDSREAIVKGGQSGAAIIPGKPQESLLIKGIQRTDLDFQMPPKKSLPALEIAWLTEWVERGGAVPEERAAVRETKRSKKTIHWAYQPLQFQRIPEVGQTNWPRSSIDYFILATLEANKLKPGPDAASEILIRRLYYDLIGLPPTPEKIDAFLTDTFPRKLERVVDELLASELFGERWGRHWLDIARYAESVTLRGLIFDEAWRYRDYVIESFNRDLRFDRFIMEQIAGDLLPCSSLEETHRARAATTYLVLGNFNYEEQDKDQLRMDIVDEQLDTIGKGLLGQTVGCARCHDHKFDPISTRDYYALAGILRNTKSAEHANVSTWLELPLPLPPEDEIKVKEQERKLAELQRLVRKKVDDIAQASTGSSKGNIPPSAIAGVVVDDSAAERVGEWQQSQHNKPYIGDGYLHDLNAGKGSKTITFHPELTAPGQYEVRLAYTANENRATNVPVTILHAEGETTVQINQRQPPPIHGHFVKLGQFHFEQGNQGYVLVSTTNTEGHVIVDAVQFLPLGESDTFAKKVPNPESTRLNRELEELRMEIKSVTEAGPKRPMVMSVMEEPRIEDAHINIRGDVRALGERVPRGFLTVASREPVDPLPAAESGRRELASWIASTNNPLTARVYVNRVWGWLFGEGIVRTPDNFGSTGDTPSHRELLDHLAVRFMAENWSTKKLIRAIVLSRTYRLSAAISAEERDPENRLFARANRRRLDAEALRDTILFVSGKLDTTRGGSTIKPETTADYGYVDESARRSVYVPAFRNALPQIFELFDFADTSVVSGRRHRSIIAPQSLYLLNHPFVGEQAEAAADRLLENSLTTRDRITRMYQQTLGRSPSATEMEIAMRHIASLADQRMGWAELYQGIFASLEFRHLQ